MRNRAPVWSKPKKAATGAQPAGSARGACEAPRPWRMTAAGRTCAPMSPAQPQRIRQEARRGTPHKRLRGRERSGPEQRDPSTARRLRRRCAQDDKGPRDPSTARRLRRRCAQDDKNRRRRASPLQVAEGRARTSVVPRMAPPSTQAYFGTRRGRNKGPGEVPRAAAAPTVPPFAKTAEQKKEDPLAGVLRAHCLRQRVVLARRH